MQMNENPNLSPADVKKLMGHSQLSTTFVYTHSNEDKTQEAISVFDKYYSTNNEIKINFNQMLSLYTGVQFIPTRELEELLTFTIDLRVEESEKYNIIRQYIDNRYPIFKTIDVTGINLNNVWDFLDLHKQKYGDEFILSPLD